MAKVRIGGAGFLRAAMRAAEDEIKRAMERGLADAAAKARDEAARLRPRGRVEVFVHESDGVVFESLDAREEYDIDLKATEIIATPPALPAPDGEHGAIEDREAQAPTGEAVPRRR